MYSVLTTKCYPCSFTVTENGKTPVSNGDWGLWFRTRAEAQTKADAMNSNTTKTFLKERMSISHAQLRAF